MPESDVGWSMAPVGRGGRRVRRAVRVVALGVVALARSALADAPTPPSAVDIASVERAADAALAAARTNDKTGLRAAATADHSDAWAVADALLGRGETAAAAAFADLAA